MSRFDGKVVFVTGIARGQGRNHAVRFAREGATVVGIDRADTISTVGYPSPGKEDLAETVRLVEAEGGRILARQGDVRDQQAIDQIVAEAIEEFGRIDIVLPNAGITTLGAFWELTDEVWDEMIAINLTGVWRTLRAAIPHMIEKGEGGSIVFTSSIAGLMGMPGLAHYAATKHGVNGIMRSLANELGPHGVRVNSVNPTNVATPMIHNENTYRVFRPDLANPTQDDARVAFSSYHILNEPWVECDDVTNAVLWLCSEEARFLTGAAIPIDLGATNKWPGH